MGSMAHPIHIAAPLGSVMGIHCFNLPHPGGSLPKRSATCGPDGQWQFMGDERRLKKFLVGGCWMVI